MRLARLLFRLALGRRLPTTSGTLTVPGISGPVTVRRDGYGIPYIEAENDEDAWYGVGFCQGQDRAFQIEGMLRFGRGTLSERVGVRGLPIDRLSRRIGFFHSAKLQLEVLAPDIRGILEAFARGASHGSRLGCRRRAHEFAVLRTTPTEVTATDILAIGKLQAFILASNWDIELARYHILTRDGPEAVAALDPEYPEWHPVSAPPGAPAGPAAAALAEDLEALRAAVGRAGGSNGWAVAGSRTSTGRPILANDPHLRPTLPPHWYLAHIRTPAWSAAGATFIGVPAFPAGHNGFAAWGVTAGLADNTDLFLEELGRDGTSVREGDTFVSCEVREETIRVKGEPDVVEKVVATPRGPLVGPALGRSAEAISLRASWLDARPLRGLLAVPRARSFEEFRRAFEQWPSASLNMVYADTSGTIGWQLVGETPRRRNGSGTIPSPGWKTGAGWAPEPVPFDEMPHVANPDNGMVASANNRPVTSGHGPFLGTDWIEGYRAARIFESLESRQDWDLEGVRGLQADELSIPWREMRDIVLATTPQSDEAELALRLLRAWDGRVASGSVAASVFEVFVAEMCRRVAKAKAPESFEWVLGKGFTSVIPHTLLVVRRVGHLVRLLRDQPDDWFEPGWSAVLEEALASAVSSLGDEFGGDETRWEWGRVRPLVLKHPAGERRLLRGVFNRGPFPRGGDANTVSQVSPNPLDPTSEPFVIASLRMVVDVGNWEDSHFVLPGGQSGNPISPHYDDQLPLWLRGEGVPIAWAPETVKQRAKSTLRLLPSSGNGPRTES